MMMAMATVRVRITEHNRRLSVVRVVYVMCGLIVTRRLGLEGDWYG